MICFQKHDRKVESKSKKNGRKEQCNAKKKNINEQMQSNINFCFEIGSYRAYCNLRALYTNTTLMLIFFTLKHMMCFSFLGFAPAPVVSFRGVVWIERK